MVSISTIICLAPREQSLAQTTQERLGYSANARLLVIHADDFGETHSVNRAIIEALEKGWVTSASVMVPCPWFPEVVRFVKEHPNVDLGVHLTLTSEWQDLRWGPVAPRDQVPSLLDADGYLPLTATAVTGNAAPADVETELRAQFERAQKMGIHATHLDSHMGALLGSKPLFKIYVKMGHAYGLPVLGQPGNYADVLPARETLIDGVIEIEPGVAAQDWMEWYERRLANLGPGVYQLTVHLAYEDAEMLGATRDHPGWGAVWRQRDLDLLGNPRFQEFLRRQGFALVKWRELARALPEEYLNKR